MLPNQLTYTCGEFAIDEFVRYCREKQFGHFMLVSDQNTYAVLGERVEARLRMESWDVRSVILDGEEVIVDEDFLIQVLLHADPEPRVYVAVGSGTITDLARFCSHRTGNVFISLPTAPSVDGFASVVAPVVIRGYKDSIPAQPPVAIFADTTVLSEAPAAMIAAGFGDMLGKYTALADWKLASLVWDEPYSASIAERMRAALTACVESAQEIQQATPAGVARLMDGLVESGFCMLLNGNTRPASGAEHHLSHYWEMKLLRQGRLAVLHGAKVGIGTILTAERYDRIRELSPEQAELRLGQATLPDWEQERKEIEFAYGPVSQRIEKEQRNYLEKLRSDFPGFKERVMRTWGEILETATLVPTAQQIYKLLRQVSAPTDVTMIGMDSTEEAEALRYAHYMRRQFTIPKLGRLLNLW